jgi:hypothetical protein
MIIVSVAINSVLLSQPAPGATGCEYATIFADYEYLTWHHRMLPCQVWARGLGQGFRIYNNLIRQIILTLHQLTSLNDLALRQDLLVLLPVSNWHEKQGLMCFFNT